MSPKPSWKEFFIPDLVLQFAALVGNFFLWIARSSYNLQLFNTFWEGAYINPTAYALTFIICFPIAVLLIVIQALNCFTGNGDKESHKSVLLLIAYNGILLFLNFFLAHWSPYTIVPQK